MAQTKITPDEVLLAAATDSIVTGQTTASTTYTDLATVGPAVTVTIGANGAALVNISALIDNNTTNARSHITFAVSGATTIAAADGNSTFIRATTAGVGGDGRSLLILVTGLTPGSNTFTMKYKVSTGTGTFGNAVGPRIITAVPL